MHTKVQFSQQSPSDELTINMQNLKACLSQFDERVRQTDGDRDKQTKAVKDSEKVAVNN